VFITTISKLINRKQRFSQGLLNRLILTIKNNYNFSINKKE
jgi:hypothetical protein